MKEVPFEPAAAEWVEVHPGGGGVNTACGTVCVQEEYLSYTGGEGEQLVYLEHGLFFETKNVD